MSCVRIQGAIHEIPVATCSAMAGRQIAGGLESSPTLRLSCSVLNWERGLVSHKTSILGQSQGLGVMIVSEAEHRKWG